MTLTLQREYAQAQGGLLRPGIPGTARIVREWDDLESAGLVRLRAEGEQENYFDVYGEPDKREGTGGNRSATLTYGVATAALPSTLTPAARGK